MGYLRRKRFCPSSVAAGVSTPAFLGLGLILNSCSHSMPFPLSTLELSGSMASWVGILSAMVDGTPRRSDTGGWKIGIWIMAATVVHSFPWDLEVRRSIVTVLRLGEKEGRQ